MASRYVDAWESFWAGTSDTPGDAIWDSDPSYTAEPHIALLEPHADTSLPIVDLGCGNGTQTRYLAGRYRRAVGVDLSAAAVEHARRADPGGSAEFLRLDLTDSAAVRDMHERLGDVNVYMRAVIHQCEPQDRLPVAAAVAELVGARGRAFVAELLTSSRTLLQEIAQEAGGPPPKLARVYRHGLKPGSVEDEMVPVLLRSSGLAVFAHGETVMVQTEHRADGTRIDLPAQWLVVGRSE